MADIANINLSKGWVKHPSIKGGWQLEYVDPIAGFSLSIVTAPPGSGLMASISPGSETTYEVWFPGLANPSGYFTLEEIKGVITYLRDKHHEDSVHMN